MTWVCLDFPLFFSVEGKVSEKKKLNEKIKERENKQKKQQEELRKRVSEMSIDYMIVTVD